MSWKKKLCIGVDYKQNVKSLPSLFNTKSISLKKSAYKNKVSGHTHNFFLLYYSVCIYILLSKISWKKYCILIGVDYKQNVDFLPSLYAMKSISLHKKSAYENTCKYSKRV